MRRVDVYRSAMDVATEFARDTDGCGALADIAVDRTHCHVQRFDGH